MLYPEFDNRQGVYSVLTITNVDSTPGANVRVEFIYIDETDCSEFNRTHTLTPNDTLTLLTSFHNPQSERGYVYAFAKATSGNAPIVWNSLIAQLLLVDGVSALDTGMNAVSFRGIGDAGGAEQAAGSPTDLDSDGRRDLDGAEYSMVPDELLVPRFLGQDSPIPGAGPIVVYSELILIGLSGGSKFTTRVDFLIYNDNEEVFSSEYEFECWAKPALLDISNIFSNQFLAQWTNQNPLEILGAPERESGWFRMDGAVASSTVEDITDPAVYCVLVERVSGSGVSDLPFSTGGQDNGSLLPRHIYGDGDPTPTNGDNQ